MTDSPDVSPPTAPPRAGLDIALNSGLAVALIGILVIGGLFGYQIYVDRQRAEAANPAMRVVTSIREQVRQSPNDAILRVRLGEALGAAGRFDEAIEQFNAALQIDPEHIGAYLD
ncbi:MAG: tetratricopeptide repeat protein, partial [Actinomycetota bacterium]|nr:tetratricopeptide repeat protein [Actinomycetota bacterium]